MGLGAHSCLAHRKEEILSVLLPVNVFVVIINSYVQIDTWLPFCL
jgi:hypothetical protein